MSFSAATGLCIYICPGGQRNCCIGCRESRSVFLYAWTGKPAAPGTRPVATGAASGIRAVPTTPQNAPGPFKRVPGAIPQGRTLRRPVPAVRRSAMRPAERSGKRGGATQGQAQKKRRGAGRAGRRADGLQQAGNWTPSCTGKRQAALSDSRRRRGRPRTGCPAWQKPALRKCDGCNGCRAMDGNRKCGVFATGRGSGGNMENCFSRAQRKEISSNILILLSCYPCYPFVTFFVTYISYYIYYIIYYFSLKVTR